MYFDYGTDCQRNTAIIHSQAVWGKLEPRKKKDTDQTPDRKKFHALYKDKIKTPGKGDEP